MAVHLEEHHYMLKPCNNKTVQALSQILSFDELMKSHIGYVRLTRRMTLFVASRLFETGHHSYLISQVSDTTKISLVWPACFASTVTSIMPNPPDNPVPSFVWTGGWQICR